MEDHYSGNSVAEATLKRLRDEWKIELDLKLAALRDEIESRLQRANQETNAGWFVRRIETLEQENLALRLERDRTIAQPDRLPREGSDEIQRLKAQNDALERDLRQAQSKLDGFRQLLNGEDDAEQQTESQTMVQLEVQSDPQTQSGGIPERDGSASRENLSKPLVAAVSDVDLAITASAPDAETLRSAVQGQAARQPSEMTSQPKVRGPKSGRAFHRAEAIFLAVKDWNRLNPFETFAINPGVLETVFHVHRQAAKDFFSAYQNELWDYHQEINVESPRWHNRGKDMEKLKAFVDERLGAD
jgi:hypothetical protein